MVLRRVNGSRRYGSRALVVGEKEKERVRVYVCMWECSEHERERGSGKARVRVGRRDIYTKATTTRACTVPHAIGGVVVPGPHGSSYSEGERRRGEVYTEYTRLHGSSPVYEEERSRTRFREQVTLDFTYNLDLVSRRDPFALGADNATNFARFADSITSAERAL